MTRAATLSAWIAVVLAPAALAADVEKSKMTKAPETVYDFTVKSVDGKDVKLEDFQGKVLLVVNVASRCGYTKRNYNELEPLYKKNKSRGFEVLAFPANNFGSQEPGSNEEIKTFCTKNYGVSFPLFAKVSVKGKEICPLYQFLTTQPGKELAGDVRWNFEKFLVGRDGRVIARFPSSTPPSDTRLNAAIEKALAAPAPAAAGS